MERSAGTQRTKMGAGTNRSWRTIGFCVMGSNKMTTMKNASIAHAFKNTPRTTYAHTVWPPYHNTTATLTSATMHATASTTESVSKATPKAVRARPSSRWSLGRLGGSHDASSLAVGACVGLRTWAFLRFCGLALFMLLRYLSFPKCVRTWAALTLPSFRDWKQGTNQVNHGHTTNTNTPSGASLKHLLKVTEELYTDDGKKLKTCSDESRRKQSTTTTTLFSSGPSFIKKALKCLPRRCILSCCAGSWGSAGTRLRKGQHALLDNS